MALVDQAVELGRRGYYVLPLIVDNGRKVPLIKWGKHASSDEDAIRAMVTTAGDPAWEEATHIAVACEPSGIGLVDLDAYYDDEEDHVVEGEVLIEEWTDLVDEHATGDEDEITVLRDPPWVTTGSNGVHIFLRASAEHPLHSTTKKITHCLDTKGVGGQFGGLVAIYYPELMPEINDLPMVPAWLSELSQQHATIDVTPEAPPKTPRFNDAEAGTAFGLDELNKRLNAIRKLWEADEGDFNNKLAGIVYGVGQYAGGGELDPDTALQALRDVLTELGAPADQYKTVEFQFPVGFKRPLTREDSQTRITPEAVEAMARKWISGTALDHLPAPKWLVPGWLEMDSLAQMYGESGVGKSFVALDVAARLSRGLGWPSPDNTPERAVRVAYVVAEGVAGMAQRKRAWESEHGAIGDMKFYPEAIQISGDEDDRDWEVAKLFLAEWAPALIIVDTQARCTVGIEENSAKEMGVVVRKIEEMRKATRACVLLVHHTAKGGNTARGTNAMKGALASEIMISRSYGRIKVRNTKQKNAVEANDAYFTLEESGESVIPHLSIEVPADMGDAVQKTNARMLIRQYLTEHPDVPQTTNEILEATGISRSYFAKEIKKLGDQNEVIRSEVRRNNRNQAAYVWNPPVSGE